MLRVHTLGGLSVVQRDGTTGASVQPRRLAVLALIARAGRRGVTREKVLALLWPDADAETGRKALSQALYTLKRDLREDALFEGVQELRLNADVASCDVVEFEAAYSRGELERAAELYHGPFLDGFRLAGAPEFERWVEEERTSLTHRATSVLEQLARQFAVQGDAARAVTWWRRLAAQDPLNGRIAVELMQALVAAGDRTGALQHARIYEALMEQELELPPDGEVVALAERIRREPAVHPEPSAPRIEPAVASDGAAATRASVAAVVANQELSIEHPRDDGGAAEAPEAPDAGDAGPVAQEWASARALRWRRAGLPARSQLVAVAAVAILVLAAAPLALRWSPAGGSGRATASADGVLPVLAVGHIADHTGGENVGPALADMLATSLARTDGLRVISTPRLYSLTESGHQPEHLASAARRAGAGLLVEASVYRTAAGALRLDLRRVDLASGALLGAHTVEAADVFTLADEGTRVLVQSLGARAPAGSVGGVSTRSVSAYKLYEQGLRAHLQGNILVSRPLFEAALAEDSTFAMAAFYAALTDTDRLNDTVRIRRALRLVEHASDRERLFIRVNWAYETSSPELYALADSLVTRYPMEVEGHLYLGRALHLRGDHHGAIPHLERAVQMDSAVIRLGGVPCHGCAALRWLIAVNAAMDSFPTAIAWARTWVAQQPNVADAWWRLAEVLEMAGIGDESVEAASRAMNLEPGRPYGWRFKTGRGLRTAQFAEVDEVLRSHMNTGTEQHRSGAQWMLAISLRYQGRLAESIVQANLNRRRFPRAHWIGNSTDRSAVAEAQAMLEGGNWRGAVALFDSVVRFPRPADPPSLGAGYKVYNATHAATAVAAGGDVASLRVRADSIEAWGRRSAQGRDIVLHHYVRGLIHALEGRDEAAVESYRRAIVSPTTGYTRVNLELARALIRLQRPAEAILPLQQALRGGIEANNLYVTHTELHEALALAWDDAGNADSAAVNYAWVVRAWQNADAELQPRRAAAERRLRELQGAR